MASTSYAGLCMYVSSGKFEPSDASMLDCVNGRLSQVKSTWRLKYWWVGDFFWDSAYFSLRVVEEQQRSYFKSVSKVWGYYFGAVVSGVRYIGAHTTSITNPFCLFVCLQSMKSMKTLVVTSFSPFTGLSKLWKSLRPAESTQLLNSISHKEPI